MQLILNHKHWEKMRKHVESSSPLEACGLLAGNNGSVREVFLIANQDQSPVGFRMEPVEQLRAFDLMEAGGLDLVAIFHSHPSGPATLSATDIAEAAYPVVQIIWSPSNPRRTEPGFQPGTDWIARGFWIGNGKVEEVALQITNDE